MKLLMTLGLALLAQAGSHPASLAKVNSYVRDQMSADAFIKVDVYLEDPTTSRLLSHEQIQQVTGRVEHGSVLAVHDEMFVADLRAGEIQMLAALPEVKSIERGDLLLAPALDDVVEIVGAAATWQHQIDGVALTGGPECAVCVIDTGVMFSHSALVAKDAAGGNFECLYGVDCPLNAESTDTDGHGTHVAGIVAAVGQVQGVAKGVNIVSMKVFADGQSTTGPFFVKRAVNACRALADEYNIRVITISITTLTQTWPDYCDAIYTPLTEAIDAATEAGIPVTIASGNQGSQTGIGYPACITSAIPIAATTDSDYAPSFASRNHLVKLFAPGVGVISTCNNGGYCSKTGTSMAAPAAAGCFAILEQYLDLTGVQMNPHEMEDLLHATGEPIVNEVEAYKRVNVLDAITSILSDAADTDQNGTVDYADLLGVLGAWGACSGEGACAGDINGNGVVDHTDLDLVIMHWTI